MKQILIKPFLPYYVFSLFVLFVTTICLKQYHLLYGLHYPDFDLGIFTQGVYLLSRFETPFVTIRGLHLFGDHFTFINLIFVPFFWIFSSPLVLLYGQTLVLGISGLVLYEICKIRLGSALTIAFVITLFYFYPPLWHLSLRQYHASSFAVLFALLFWLGFEKKNPTLALVSCIGLFLTKENMPLLAGGLAFYTWTFKRWKPGFYLWILSILAFALLLKLVIPHFSGMSEYAYSDRALGAFYGWFNGDTSFSHFMGNTLLREENPEYLFGLFSPLMFLPLINPGAFLLNPLFHLNLITDWPYSHSIQYQYIAGIIATMMISTVEALAYLEKKFATIRWKKTVTASVTALLAGVLYMNITILGPHYLRPNKVYAEFPVIEHDVISNAKEINTLVGDDAITVHYILLGLFATRELTFMWPNPFENSYYGYHQTETHETKPEYLVWLDTIPLDHTDLIEQWGFEIAKKYPRLILYRRKEESVTDVSKHKGQPDQTE
jgi:uncharacterized membrane protein